ncbi:MAG: right-handed parallel beta-helix repeat-containing protein, partial [Oscillospiraceae bacterium]|nr:right-handed parallel beta-helix repeat-containing protein [Oscillospiraceae bacterium]
ELREPGFWLRLWAVGMLISACYFVFGYLRFRAGLRRTLRAPLPSDLAVFERLAGRSRLQLWRSGAVSTPMLVGLVRPVLLLPDRAYSEAMLRGILRHELTHYRRGDIAFKWFAVLVTVIHWFNPITRLFRTELDRACELACDEKLLREMDAGEKQLYGELLLKLAADRVLPRSVVATSFAVEKRNLKERLVQIMTYKKTGRAGFALMLAAILLLTGCAGALGPGSGAQTAAPTESPVPAPESYDENPLPAVDPQPNPVDAQYGGTVYVHTVDEFLASIGPDTTIVLEAGTYDLSTASDYGAQLESGYYTWDARYDGYQLLIRDLSGLTIQGSGTENVTLAAVPRYANVLAFSNCSAISVTALTAGHTQAPGYCAGGVLDFAGCDQIGVNNCALYGCGTLGVCAENCRNLYVQNTDIYECSMGAVWASGCYDVRLEDSSVHDCGLKDDDFNAYVLFMPQSTTGFAVVNTVIEQNDVQYLLDSRYSQEVYMLGCQIRSNRFDTCVFSIAGASPVVADSAFVGNSQNAYYPDNYTGYAVDENGEDLISFDLDHMTLKKAAYNGPTVPSPAPVSGSPSADGSTTEYHVQTVDEFLAAIGPDTTIYIDAERLDLSTASNYGGYGNQYYYWEADYDGPTLVITGVSNFHIVGQGKDKTEIVAVPRYADVLRFLSGEVISIEGLTAGHTMTGDCSGDVLGFENVTNLSIRDCGLYGCGVWGIRANNCFNMDVQDTEIYSCSAGAFIMFQSENVTMENVDIHDMPSAETAYLNDCTNFTYNGVKLGSGGHKL